MWLPIDLFGGGVVIEEPKEKDNIDLKMVGKSFIWLELCLVSMKFGVKLDPSSRRELIYVFRYSLKTEKYNEMFSWMLKILKS